MKFSPRTLLVGGAAAMALIVTVPAPANAAAVVDCWPTEEQPAIHNGKDQHCLWGDGWTGGLRIYGVDHLWAGVRTVTFVFHRTEGGPEESVVLGPGRQDYDFKPPAHVVTKVFIHY